MNILKRIQECWHSIWSSARTSEIECPYCANKISLASLPGIEYGYHGSGQINIVAAGSIIPCPKCGRNLSEFILTIRNAIKIRISG